jgi:transcriptional regulator
VVPTWNFAVVHATGKLRPVDGKKELNELLSKLIAKFESYEGTNYDFSKIDDTYKYGMMNGIIGFELEIELLEGKFKLGQDRSPADKQSLLKKLTEAKAPRSLRDFTASFYDRQGKA